MIRSNKKPKIAAGSDCQANLAHTKKFRSRYASESSSPSSFEKDVERRYSMPRNHIELLMDLMHELDEFEQKIPALNTAEEPDEAEAAETSHPVIAYYFSGEETVNNNTYELSRLDNCNPIAAYKSLKSDLETTRKAMRFFEAIDSVQGSIDLLKKHN